MIRYEKGNRSLKEPKKKNEKSGPADRCLSSEGAGGEAFRILLTVLCGISAALFFNFGTALFLKTGTGAALFEASETMYQKELLSMPASKLLLMTLLLSPVIEELLFRGGIYGFLRRYTGEGFAIFLSALLFALWHDHVIQYVTAFLMGLLLAWLYGKSGKLGLPILLHATANAMNGLFMLPKPGAFLSGISDSVLFLWIGTACAGTGVLLCLKKLRSQLQAL